MKTVELDSLDSYKIPYLAKAFDFSPQYLTKKLRENFPDIERSSKGYLLTKNQVIELADLIAIKVAFSKQEEPKNYSIPKAETKADTSFAMPEIMIDIMREQLQVKDKQIEQLNITIQELIDTNKALSESNKALAANAAVHTAADKKEILSSETAIVPANQRSFLDKLKDLFR